MREKNLSWNYLNKLTSGFKPEPALNKKGRPIKHDFFELPMSDEAFKLAVSQGWKRKTIYKKDEKTSELVPRTMFEIPEPSMKPCKP